MNSVSTCTQLETNDNSLSVADSGKLGDNVDSAELFVIRTETLSIFRAEFSMLANQTSDTITENTTALIL